MKRRHEWTDAEKVELLKRAQGDWNTTRMTMEEFEVLLRLAGCTKRSDGKWAAGSMDDHIDELRRLRAVAKEPRKRLRGRSY